MRREPLILTAVAALCGGFVVAGEREIMDDLRDYFRTDDIAQRARLVSRIVADDVYDRAKVKGWLHGAGLFDITAEASAVGEGDLLRESVPLAADRQRQVFVRLPAKYDPAKAWPLIYALHGTGGEGPEFVAYLERVLADRISEYIIAAPSQYEQFVIHEHGPDDEHVRVLAHLRRRFHLDSNRTHITGYSRGGHATWTLAVLHADQFASGLALAGTFNLTGVDALWDAFLPNARHVPIWTVWGAGDTVGDASAESPQGGIAGVNAKLRAASERLKLPATFLELVDKGHGDVRPDADTIAAWLAVRRPSGPQPIEHTFRWPYQAHTYWLDAGEWKGAVWDDKPFTITPRKGESPLDAFHRELRGRLGRISGRIDGQTIDVRRDHVNEVTIWIEDGMIDWGKPVAVKVSGRVVFEGVLTPDLGVCLAEAARTYDLDRLRWGGVRFRSGKKAEIVRP